MPVFLRPATQADATRIADILIASRAAFLPYAPSPHPDNEIRAWVRDILLPGEDVTVATANGEVTGVLAIRRADNVTWITQLYLLPSHTGGGVGSVLLRHALETSRRPIRLRTFQQNHGARRFYERRGFVAISFTDGADNEEHCPDVVYELAALASTVRSGNDRSGSERSPETSRGPMTPEQQTLVRDSFAKVVPIAPAAAAMFYDRLFALDPTLRPLFKGDMNEQGRKLMAMIGTAVVNLHQLDRIVPAVQDLGRRHKGYGVKDADYDTVAQALLWTLEQGLGAAFTPATKDAWAACYGVLAGEMKAATAA